MNVIVLVKYVADIENLPSDAWDLETGTLRRGRLQMVANPLDDRALHAARSIAGATGGRLLVLSMGPPSAERVCRRAVAFGADEAVLLTDAAFAGADTLATARTLRRAIERLCEPVGLADTLIFAGMQSPDGDTAQVPAELAQMIGAPLVPYVTNCSFNGNRLITESMVRSGRVRHTLDRPPLVATWTALAEQPPFHTSLDGFRRAASASIAHLTAADLDLRPDEVGLKGSTTRVISVVNVPRQRKGGRVVDLSDAADPAAELADVAAWIRDHAGAGGAAEGVPADQATETGAGQPDAAGEAADGATVADPASAADKERGAGVEVGAAGGAGAARGAAAPAATDRDRSPDIWVFVEPDGNGIEAGSLELLGKARELADEIDAHATAFVVQEGVTAGDDVGPRHGVLVDELVRAGATRVVRARVDSTSAEPGDRTGPGSTPCDAPRHHRDAHALAEAARTLSPRTVLIPATLHGRTVSALAAAMLGAGLTADCTGLALEPPAAEAPAEDAPGGAAAAASAAETGGPAGSGANGSTARRLLQTRPALGGNVLATIVSTAGPGVPEMATVRSGVFTVRAFEAQRVTVVDVETGAFPRFRDGACVRPEPAAGRPGREAGGRGGTGAGEAGGPAGVDTGADVVVAVGLGVGSEEAVIQLVRPFIRALGERLGVRVSLACSRAAVDAGILPYSYQIGQTGKSVRPSLYIALGISGAIQHRLGMEHSASVLSVNPDPEAPIHGMSDLSVIGTVADVLPVLLDRLPVPVPRAIL